MSQRRSQSPYDVLPPVPTFIVTSNDMLDGAPLPLAHVFNGMGLEGQNRSPHLVWSAFPVETKSFAVTCFDPDAPTGSGFWHWLVVNIPSAVNELLTDAGSGDDSLPGDAFHTRNDYGLAAYGGAAPPPGHGDHRYIFAVHALSCEELGVDSSSSGASVGFNLTFNTIARAVMTPIFGR